jgi:hypothetical protein
MIRSRTRAETEGGKALTKPNRCVSPVLQKKLDCEATVSTDLNFLLGIIEL